MIRSKALEINLARTQVEVPIDPRYACLQEVMSRYYGLLEGLNAYLKEVSHPYKNWQYIVGGGRGYALDYFHMFKSHPRGPDAARVLMDVFFEALAAQIPTAVKVDAADNLLLFIQKIIKTSPPFFDRFAPLINDAFDRIANLPEALFILFVRSFYTLKRVAGDWSDSPVPRETDTGAIHRMLARALRVNLDYWLLQPDPFAAVPRRGPGPAADRGSGVDLCADHPRRVAPPQGATGNHRCAVRHGCRADTAPPAGNPRPRAT